MKIKLRYFASISEATQKTEEYMEVQNISVQELFSKLKEQYDIRYKLDQIRIAVNDSYTNKDYILQENDLVVFIRPLAEAR